MSENTTETTETTTETGGAFAPDDLENVPAEKLAAMLREKRKAEKSLRERLRDAESRLEGLDGTVQAFQRSAFHKAAQGHGVLDSALSDLDAAVDLASVLAEDGTVDEQRVAETLREVRQSRPHYFRSVGSSAVDHPGGSGESSAPAASWGDVLGASQ